MTQNSDFLTRLDDLAVLRIDGEDAASFLHTQLSNDIESLAADQARLAAYCSPKGRMLASMVICKESTEAGSALLALIKQDLLEPLLKRLRMFVLRAKVSFDVMPLQVYGVSLSGTGAEKAGAAAPAPWKVSRDNALIHISAPATSAGHERYWLIAPAEADESALASTFSGAQPVAATTWQSQDIDAGLGWVEQANVELFIPQSLNYDLIGGVSFTKGCYPGQEVVARAHYRGAVKRRAAIGHCKSGTEEALVAGMDVYDAKRPGSPAGRIINAASAEDAGSQDKAWRLLLEVNLGDIGQADFRVLSPEGPVIQLQPLPYSLEAVE